MHGSRGRQTSAQEWQESRSVRENEDGRREREGERARWIHSSRGDWTVLEGGAADKSEREREEDRGIG